MNRRSMLGFLGVGAAAGPQVVQQLSASVNEAPMTLGMQSPGVGGYSDSLAIAHKYKAEDYLKNMQGELACLTVDPIKWVADRVAQDMKDHVMGYGSTHYSNIDPDIRNMKSITESAKMRMHFERKAKRQYELQKESLTHRIAQHLGLVA